MLRGVATQLSRRGVAGMQDATYTIGVARTFQLDQYLTLRDFYSIVLVVHNLDVVPDIISSTNVYNPPTLQEHVRHLSGTGPEN